MILFASIILSYFILNILIPNLILDKPNERSNHINPTPRGGGIVFLITPLLLIPIFNFDYSIYILIIPLGIVGLCDDFFSLKSIYRFIIQALTVVLILILTNNQILLIDNFYIFAFLFFVGTSVINFSNFIDGIDGLLSSIAIVFFISATLLLETNVYLPILGSLLSFYLFNKYPAKVFMGDIGSTIIGALIFNALINSNSYTEFTKLILIISPILFDCVSCIVMRLYKKENIFKPHSIHLYQRLVKNGMSHKNVTYLYSICSILIALAAYFSSLRIEFFITLFVLLLGIYLDKTKAASIQF